MHVRAFCLAIALAGTWSAALAQGGLPRIWDIPLGTHVRDLPARDFVEPACGTNGGPAGLPIGSFEQFERCPPGPGGLREVTFRYDDTWEYVGLARRDRSVPQATTVLDQPVILSYLIAADGRVRGYRIFTDPRAAPAVRMLAYEVSLHFKARYGLDAACVDLAPAEGERPIEGLFVKQLCERDADGRRVTVEARFFHRPGQRQIDPHTRRATSNEFESSARLEVLQVGPLPPIPSEELAEPAQAHPDQRSAFLAGATVHCPGCDLAGADLRRRDLTGANLADADLEGALLHRAILRGADLSGANLAGANLNRSDLTQARLHGATLTNAMLYRADGPRANFSGSDLSGVMAGKVHLALAILEGVKLDFADLAEARLNDASLVGASLNGAYLPLAVMFRADLRNVVAEGATLAEADLRNADLGGIMLRGANLFDVDLAGANLAGADFTGARLLSANLAGADQRGAIFAGAVMPDNSIHP